MFFSLLANLAAIFGIVSLFVPNFFVTVNLPGDPNLPLTLITETVKENSPLPINFNSLGMKITAGSAAVLDVNSNTILWRKNSIAVRPIASITKLMTALVFFDHQPSLDSIMTIEETDFREGNRSFFPAGSVVRVKDLLYASLVSSNNTATAILARSTKLSSEEFVRAMNDKAKVLGLQQTVFADVTGLDPKNVSTAEDILRLATVAFANPTIREATVRSEYTLSEGSVLKNTDQLLGSYLNIGAGKTGSLDEAGYCLVSEVIAKDGQAIIVAVLGSATTADRFQDLKAVAQWTFDNFIWPKK